MIRKKEENGLILSLDQCIDTSKELLEYYNVKTKKVRSVGMKECMKEGLELFESIGYYLNQLKEIKTTK